MLNFPIEAYRTRKINGKLVTDLVIVIGQVKYKRGGNDELYVKCKGRCRESMVRRVKQWDLISKSNFDREKAINYFDGL